MTALQEAPLEELRAAQELLQRAHDYTEAHGFDILHYDPEDDAEAGPCCFIGAVRRGAGLVGAPGEIVGDGGRGVGHYTKDASYGNGPELALALRALDNIALEELPVDAEARYAQDYDHGYSIAEIASEYEKEDTGRYIEALGFSGQDSQEDALRIYRQALTDVHNLIEARS